MYTPTVMTKRDILIEIDGFDQNLTRGIDSEFYRMCIVKFGYDVYFMEAITTQINEYGADRITLQNNKNSLIKTRNANAYLIIKYKDYYFKYPKAFLQRLVNILIAQLNILRVNWKNNN